MENVSDYYPNFDNFNFYSNFNVFIYCDSQTINK